MIKKLIKTIFSKKKSSQIIVKNQYSKKESQSGWTINNFNVAKRSDKTRFHDFSLNKNIMRAIYDLNYQYCTPIQADVLKYSLLGQDAIGKAQTGTGKTAAFLISLISHLLKTKPNEQFLGEPRSVIIAPTRELSIQITKEAKNLAKYTNLNILNTYGGVSIEKQIQSIDDSTIDILIATPGRLIDLMNQNQIFLDVIEVLILDEADRMLDMGFIPQVRTIIRNTPPKNKRQTLLFSATFNTSILEYAKQWTNNAKFVEIESNNKQNKNISQYIYTIESNKKMGTLLNLITKNNITKAIVFANRKDEVSKLCDFLQKNNIKAAQMSGNVHQKKRMQVLEKFKSNNVHILVATDVAGRGIHINNITHVFNFDLPDDPEEYIHRIGRTGRAGAHGISISFASENDSYNIPALENFLDYKISCSLPPENFVIIE